MFKSKNMMANKTRISLALLSTPEKREERSDELFQAYNFPKKMLAVFCRDFFDLFNAR